MQLKAFPTVKFTKGYQAKANKGLSGKSQRREKNMLTPVEIDRTASSAFRRQTLQDTRRRKNVFQAVKNPSR